MSVCYSIRTSAIGAMLCLLAVTWAHVASAGDPSASHADTRVVTNLVGIHLTVVDKDGEAVTTLRPEDVRVLEDGRPQTLMGFEPLRDVPLELTLGIDISASQESVLPMSKAAAHLLIDSLLRTDKDRGAVYSFATEGLLQRSPTNNRKTLHDIVDSLRAQVPPGYVGGRIVVGPVPPKGAPPLPGATSLWDALQAITQKIYVQQYTTEGRRVVILFTDGEDTSSVSKKKDALENLVRAGIAVYAIGQADKNYFGEVNYSGLRKVTEETGGRAYFPRKSKELQSVVEQLQKEMSAPYLLVYQPAREQGDKSYHKVQIEIVNPELRKHGLRLAYLRGYFSK